MPTSTESTRAVALLQELARRFVDHPEAIKIAATRTGTGEIYFGLSCHEDDEGKLIGKSRSHVDAFSLLIDKMGRASGERWFYRLITKGTPRKTEPERKKTERYNALATADLLARILGELSIGDYVVDVEKGQHAELPAFILRISVRDNADYCALTYQDPSFGSAQATTLIGALGTIFRAIARKDGVWFQLYVKCRRNEN